MFQRILIIFENENICEEALTYCRELALRMDSEVAILMLVEMAFLDRAFVGSKRSVMRDLQRRVGGVLGDLSSQFLMQGIPVSVALRVGDAAQELLKFLAQRRPFQALIWGSGEELPDGSPQRKTHWMNKVMDRLECPFLSVSSRERPS